MKTTTVKKPIKKATKSLDDQLKEANRQAEKASK